MKKIFLIGLIITLLFACKKGQNKEQTPIAQVPAPILNLAQANKIATLPIHCIYTEYPNKLGQVIGSDADLQPPSALHPAFYGCFDWHSSVHGHWSLVALLKKFPKLGDAAKIKKMLLSNISKENIEQEVLYFQGKHNKSYERTYGWAWLLKLAEELHTWEDATAKELAQNLQPLTDLIAQKYIDFLPKLQYPIRVGTHSNTAFGLAFAWDYAETVDDHSLKESIKNKARKFYLKDKNCPLSWEPGGADFLSPCLQEAALMKRILPLDEFKAWLADFLPQLYDKNFSLDTGKVADRTDGHLVHLDGLNYSRAWALHKIIEGMPALKHLENTANKHISHALPNLIGDDYAGGHWLGSFAIYALSAAAK